MMEFSTTKKARTYTISLSPEWVFTLENVVELAEREDGWVFEQEDGTNTFLAAGTFAIMTWNAPVAKNSATPIRAAK